MKFWQRQHNQTGDTIVEVMIAIAIIGSVLVGAFVVSQKSAKAVRDSQEHAEMAQILKGQVELARTMALAQADDTNGVFKTSPTKYFCIDASNPAALARIDLPLLGTALPNIDSDDFSKYITTNPSTPGPCASIQGRYNVAGSYNPTTKVFTFVGRWDRIGGGKNEEKLSYRIYPGQVVFAPAPPTCSPSNQIVVTLDASLSMDDKLPSGMSLWDKLREVSTNFFATSNIGAGNSAAIVAFYSSASIWQPMTTSVVDLQNTLVTRPPVSGTAYVAGLEQTNLAWLPNTLQRILVFISDGRANESDSEILPISDAMKNPPSNIEIYTIGIGDPANFGTLQAMATSPSHFASVTNELQFEATMARIASIVRCF